MASGRENTMDCTRFQNLLAGYLNEELEEPDRVAWRQHLLGCATCRVMALEREPSLLFALASRRETDSERVEACTASVLASIRTQRLERQIHRRRRPWLAAAAAAVLALGGGLAWHEIGHERPVTQASVMPTPGSRNPEAQARQQSPEVDVENDGANVRVYQLATDENTTVTFVVDPSLEL